MHGHKQMVKVTALWQVCGKLPENKTPANGRGSFLARKFIVTSADDY
jgi:hypothetical protein